MTEAEVSVLGRGVKRGSVGVVKETHGLKGTTLVKRSKYGAVKTTVDGIVFHSAKEAKRYGELKLLEKAGEIHQLLLQPRYGLYIKPFVRADIADGELIKCGDYVGDFQYYTAAGERVVEDVKGMASLPIYRLKRRIVEALYGIKIIEIR